MDNPKDEIKAFRQQLEPHLNRVNKDMDRQHEQILDQAFTDRDSGNWKYEKLLVSPFKLPELIVVCKN